MLAHLKKHIHGKEWSYSKNKNSFKNCVQNSTTREHAQVEFFNLIEIRIPLSKGSNLHLALTGALYVIFMETLKVCGPTLGPKNIGQFGEVSEATHSLLGTLATSRVGMAGPSVGKRGLLRSEEGERAVAIATLQRRLGVMTVKCQANSLLGRLETLGPGGAATAGRRGHTAAVEARWRRESRAFQLAVRGSWRALRTSFARLT